VKLLYCQSCRDLIRLVSNETRFCACRAVCGRYVDGRASAVYHGPATLVGLDDRVLQGVEGVSSPLWIYAAGNPRFQELASVDQVRRATHNRLVKSRDREHAVLNAYNDLGQATLRDVATYTGHSLATVQRTAKALESRGLLQKGVSTNSRYVRYMPSKGVDGPPP
jgi:hypothetical protein